MTRSKSPYALTSRELAAVENGRAVGWPIGRARAALGRDPGDGRYLWSVTFPGRRGRWNADLSTFDPGERQASEYGKADTIAAALDAIEAAHKARS